MNALGTTFPIGLRFVSDWHVGTGEGRVGVVDALIRRDADELPFVPAKTLLGVWRDAAETIAFTLDGGTRGSWATWVDWLFGSQPSEPDDATAAREEAPAPAALSLTPSRLPSALRDALRGKDALIEATVLLRPGAMLDPDSGTAQEDFLRLEERALGGLLLQAEATVRTDGTALPEAAELLLRAGARLVDALGGKRNRGTGRLVLRLDGTIEAAPVMAAGTPVPPDDRLAVLLADEGLLDNPGEPPEARSADAPLLADGRSDGARRRWRLELEALSPVVIVDRVVGNNITTRDEIPGTTLLPVILTALPHSSRVRLDDVRVGNAVPAVLGHDGTAHPAPTEPMVWHRTDKGQGDTVINAAREPLDPAQRPKPARRRAARLADGTDPRWRQCRPGTSVSTHAVVNDIERRPTADAGGLFSYYGIEPGTVLVSDLVLPDGVTLRLAKDDVLRVGRSRKDDFGRVRVRSLTPLDDAPPRKVGADGVRKKNLRVWLLSDVLLRDERLAYDASPQRLATVLGDALDVRPLTVMDRDPRLRPTMAQAVRRDGFTPRWGRPRSSQVGLKAGSIVTFTLPDGVTPDPAKVAEVERDGIGDRTVEGFGRLVIDPPELVDPRPAVERPERKRTPGDPAPATATPSLPDVSPHEPHPIELAAWRREIRREVAAIAADPDRQRTTLPGLQKTTRAQRGVLRGQVDRLARPDGVQLVEDWFATLARSVTRRDAWPPQSRAMLRDLLLTDKVWTALELHGDKATELVLAPGRERLLRATLRHEALAVLVDELVRQAQADEEAPTRQEVRS